MSVADGREFPFDRVAEFTDDGIALEVRVGGDPAPRAHRGGASLAERFADFLPFAAPDPAAGLGEGGTPLLPAPRALTDFTGLPGLMLKNETMNPTWSFKDRGTLACVWLAHELGERVMATISTGNMGHSVAAYAARNGLRAVVFVPAFAPPEKVAAIAAHGATVVRVAAPDYGDMKRGLLASAAAAGLRVVSGNGPHRVEGYKMEAFEMWEQLEGGAPDFIAVPSSACGHIRGIHKGWRELHAAGLVARVPRMIVVQAANNAPLVEGIRRGLDTVVPFSGFETVAEAITTGNPPGGDEIVRKAKALGWPAESATEEEILDGQRRLAEAGYLVEPAAATSLHAVRKLREAGVLQPDARVVLMLTGSGLKDVGVLARHSAKVLDVDVARLPATVAELAGEA